MAYTNQPRPPLASAERLDAGCVDDHDDEDDNAKACLAGQRAARFLVRANETERNQSASLQPAAKWKVEEGRKAPPTLARFPARQRLGLPALASQPLPKALINTLKYYLLLVVLLLLLLWLGTIVSPLPFDLRARSSSDRLEPDLKASI